MISPNETNGLDRELNALINHPVDRAKKTEIKNIQSHNEVKNIDRNCFYKGKIKAACGPGLDGVDIPPSVSVVTGCLQQSHLARRGL
ncbi:MAG: hypothetical protein P1V20_27860 [Verrucomicrobiales bacterium]|nr:hypothetical protein [Verrucomicrobiales bacterium]